MKPLEGVLAEGVVDTVAMIQIVEAWKEGFANKIATWRPLRYLA